jgi:hypothetical protein
VKTVPITKLRCVDPQVSERPVTKKTTTSDRCLAPPRRDRTSEPADPSPRRSWRRKIGPGRAGPAVRGRGPGKAVVARPAVEDAVRGVADEPVVAVTAASVDRRRPAHRRWRTPGRPATPVGGRNRKHAPPFHERQKYGGTNRRLSTRSRGGCRPDRPCSRRCPRRRRPGRCRTHRRRRTKRRRRPARSGCRCRDRQ